MHLPHIPNKLRHLLSFCIVMMIVSAWYIKKNSGTKNDYQHATGKIITLTKRLSPDLPYKDYGAYRYIVIENYAYPFEVYTDEQGRLIDSLKKGDVVTAYFYEIDDTHEEHINRFLQFLQKGNKIYFTQRDFYKQLGYVMILLLLIFAYFSYRLYKAGKISY